MSNFTEPRTDRLVAKTVHALLDLWAAPSARSLAYSDAYTRLNCYGQVAAHVLGLCPAADAWNRAVEAALHARPRPAMGSGTDTFDAWRTALTAEVLRLLGHAVPEDDGDTPLTPRASSALNDALSAINPGNDLPEDHGQVVVVEVQRPVISTRNQGR